MISEQQTKPGFTFSGWHMFACMGIFFGIIIAVNIYMAILATSSWTGLVVKNSYVASQGFNDRAAEAKTQSDRGFWSRIDYQDGKLTFVIFDRSDEIQAVKRAKVKIGRPAFEQKDQVLTPECSEFGQCELASLLLEGEWSLELAAELTDITYRRDARLRIRRNELVEVE